MLVRFLPLLLAAALCAQAQLNDGDAHGDAPYLVESGWTPLFNGHDLSGWHGLGQPNEWFTTRAIFWDRLLGPTRLAGIGSPGDRMLNGPHGRTVNLVTDQKFGDVELYLEFMLAKGSNSGVYLHGLYEVQIFDSYGSTEPMTSSDCGGIYHRWIDNHGVGGSAPSRNACRRPGEWQSYHIWFRAPRFDASGKKTENAKFIRVVFNGLSVQENVEVDGPTRAAMNIPEAAENPIMLQGDHGPWRSEISTGGRCGRLSNGKEAPMFSSFESLNAINRRAFLHTAVAGGAALASTRPARAADALDLKPLRAEIEQRHDESVSMLQEWIRQPSIAAENRGMTEGCDLMMRLLRDAGFGQVTKIPTDRHPGVFATLDAGAPRTVGLYFMYDVKQVDPAEWSSPPWDAALVEKPGLGKVLVGRGAVNQKGPQAALLAALRAFRHEGRKLPVNLVFVAEGEEEIGSPHFPQIVHRPEVLAALGKCTGVVMPSASQALDGAVTIDLGAKGVIELELVSSGERWGRGPKHDVHSSNEARVDSPAWHLVQALATLVGPDGHTPAIYGFADKARPIAAAEKAQIVEAAKRQSEATAKKQLGVERWVHDVDWLEALELLVSRPTVNIEGLVGGYIGPGGKTILPHRAVAKLDLRLVPDMTAEGALAALKAHLARRGFADIEVNMTGGYDPTTTSADSAPIRAEQAVYRRAGIDPILWPRSAGSWPGYVFTGEPLRLAAGHFGLGHGNGAHAPDEYYVIESKNPKVYGLDGAAFSHVEYLYELAAVS